MSYSKALNWVDAMFKSGLDGVFAGFSKDITRMAFKDVVVNLDGQRVPIKSDERKSTHGTYPYYGATGIIDYVDEYIFDGENLLISEDGANLVARKYPIAFIATGKYWVNNHAHVVCAKPIVTTNSYLQWFFAWCDLSSYITGSAQPKLSQGKLNAISVPIPALNVQDNIVCQLNTLNEQTTQLKNELIVKIGMFNQLKASVLDGAFRGEL
jgi:type I restriction enzyme S subunit